MKIGATVEKALALLCTLTILGCSIQQKSRLEVDRWVDVVYSDYIDLDSKSGKKSDDPLLGGDVTLSFDEALKRLWRHDPTLKKSDLAIEEAALHRKAKKSLLQPTIDLAVGVDLTGDNDASLDEMAYGGIYFRYNLKKAFFSGEEVAMADLNLTDRQKEKKAKKEALCYSLRDRYRRYKSLTHQLNLCRENEILLNETVSVVEAMTKANGGPSARTVMVTTEAMATGDICDGLEGKKNRLRYELREMVGATGDGALTLSVDKTASPPFLVDPDRAIITAWKNRPEVTRLMNELMVAEIAYRSAWRNRLPRFDLSFGYGAILLERGSEEENAVVNVGLTIPIFDAGMTSRKKARARIVRDTKRIALREYAQKLAREVRYADDAFRAARRHLEKMKKVVAARATLHRETSILNKSGMAPSEERLNTKVAFIEATMKMTLATELWLDAVSTYSQATGKTCIPSSEGQ